VVKDIEAKRKVEVYGIGIEDNSVSMIYKQHSIIADSKGLQDALLSLIQQKLLGRQV